MGQIFQGESSTWALVQCELEVTDSTCLPPSLLNGQVASSLAKILAIRGTSVLTFC